MLKKGIFAFPILFYMRIQKCLNNSYYPMKWTILDKIGKIVAKIEHAYSVTTSIFAYGFQQIKSGMSFLIFKI